MANKYLIDTNVAIDYINNRLPVRASDLIDNIQLNISVITRMELLVWKKATPAHLKLIQNFIDACTVFGLEEPIIVKAIEIRREYNIKLPDAIISATGVVYGLTLITRNTSDFKNINGLFVIDPWL